MPSSLHFFEPVELHNQLVDLAFTPLLLAARLLLFPLPARAKRQTLNRSSASSMGSLAPDVSGYRVRLAGRSSFP